MDLESLAAFARTHGEEAFVQRFPHLFLALDAPIEPSTMPFSTEAVSEKALTRLLAAQVHAIIPMAKAAGNPYSDRIAIGRARNCDVVLRDPSVSKLHAHLRTTEDGGYVLVDIGSQNGTEVDGVRLGPSSPHPCGAGARVKFGSVSARVIDAASAFRHLHLTGNR